MSSPSSSSSLSGSSGLSNWFVQRPIATSLLMLWLVLLGAWAYNLLPIAALPQVEIPTIQVSADLPGAAAEVMATTVASPLERQLALIYGVTEMTSSSSLGHTSITLQFDLNRSIDAAAQDVQAAISAAVGQLPKTLPHPPAWERANPADFQIMTLAVRSDELPLPEVDRYADNYIAQQLSRIPGVGLIDLHGEQRPAVRIDIDPRKIAALGLTLEDIRAVLGNATVSAPKGTLDSQQRTLSVDTTDQLQKASAYDDLILAYRHGAPVRVRDIGRATDGVEDVKRAAWVGGQRAIIVDIHKAPGYNVVAAVDAIKAKLPEIVDSLPPSMNVSIVSDRTQTIRAAFEDIRFTLLLSVFLVVLVVFAFLRGLWATIIPAVAIPLSILGTFAVMYLLGYSLNNLSLMGLTVATGFVVDDAIVVIENIMRHIENGETPLAAALTGARQVGFTVVSMTTSLIAAFIPLLFMGGLIGRLFREFSVTIAVTLIVSAIVSLTVTPMMCRVFLRAKAQSHGEQGSRLGQLVQSWFDRLHRGYERSLDAALARRPLMLGLTLASVVLTGVLYWLVPKGFFPQQDTGLIMGATEASADISAPAMAKRQLELVRIAAADTDVAAVYSWIGESGTMNNGRVVISLKPFDQRHASAAQVMARLKKRAAAVSGIALRLQARQDLQIGGRSSKSQFQYTMESVDLHELLHWAPALVDKLKSMHQIEDATTDLDGAAPGTLIVIDRSRAAQFGVTPQQLDDTLYDALGQRQVATIFTHNDQYHVVLEVDAAYKLDERALDGIYLASSSGRMVPLSVLSRVEKSSTPLSINHQGQFPAVTVSFNLAEGVALGQAVTLVEQAKQALEMPASVHGNFQGAAKVFQASLASQPVLIGAALIVVYIVLGILYESYVHPLTILSTLPSAGLGALLALMLLGIDLNLISLIGVFLLIGIVKKNAIMMIDFASELRHEHGADAADAIRQACLLRFRPIMMTTLAALLGGLPLALGHGPGSEVRTPMGVALVGGLLLSQVLTLYTTPVIYLYLDRASVWLKRQVRREAVAH